jgi:ribosomal protein S18 acetylase RimI-like enzyme
MTSMTWKLTGSLDDFLGAADGYLRAEPVLNTVLLTVCERLRLRGPAAFGDDPPWFGWHEAGSGAVDGAFLRTPPFPLLAAGLPDDSAGSLIAALAAAGLRPPAVNIPAAAQAGFGAAWRQASGGGVAPRLRSRLFRLAALVQPDPAPAGSSRPAADGDYDLLVGWHEAFHRELGQTAEDPRRSVEAGLGQGWLQLWEDGGRPVAMATRTADVAGVVRVAGVYTPPQHRRRGYAGGATAAVTQAALDGGADDVVLFTDLANPTSNALYQRLGYRPVAERVVLELMPAPHGGDVTDDLAASS